jgi:hypothetical protein
MPEAPTLRAAGCRQGATRLQYTSTSLLLHKCRRHPQPALQQHSNAMGVAANTDQGVCAAPPQGRESAARRRVHAQRAASKGPAALATPVATACRAPQQTPERHVAAACQMVANCVGQPARLMAAHRAFKRHGHQTRRSCCAPTKHINEGKNGFGYCCCLGVQLQELTRNRILQASSSMALGWYVTGQKCAPTGEPPPGLCCCCRQKSPSADVTARATPTPHPKAQPPSSHTATWSRLSRQGSPPSALARCQARATPGLSTTGPGWRCTYAGTALPPPETAARSDHKSHPTTHAGTVFSLAVPPQRRRALLLHRQQ